MFIISIVVLKIVRHSINLATAWRRLYLLEEQCKISVTPYYTASANYYLSS